MIVTMQAEATIGDLGERDFLREIESLLRTDQVDQALARISLPLARHCQLGGPLPASLIDLTADDIVVEGWDELEPRMREVDREDYPVTAIGIEITDHPEETTDSAGPHIQTCFFTDSAYPFSECDREALLDGYSSYGSEWQGSSDHCDGTIAIRGLDEGWAAVAALGASLRRADSAPDDRELQAFALGASYLAALIHSAVRRTVERKGLSRPLAIFVAGDSSYPGFDAPVATPLDEVSLPRTEPEPESEPTEYLASEETSLPDPTCSAIDPEPDGEVVEPGASPEAHPDTYYDMPDSDAHVTGTQLRKRLVTDESIALTQESEPESLLQRLLRRIKPRS